MIKVLDKSVANKIAAGEVIERPISIVKELVENSIDAGATAIVVEIKKGGISYIRVTDNGCGIDPDEAEIAFLRHATSKISTDKDLDAIESLGFRGEALASIAAVSDTELLTKQAQNNIGRKVCIRGGNVASNTAVGCPDGTTIVVTDLFYNTPARLKFLKSEGVEGNRIIEFVSQIAVAYSNIKFRMINNGNILFSTQGKGDVYNSIITVYNKEIGKQLVPVSKEDTLISVNGFVSAPGEGQTNRKSQIFFVNGRLIKSKVIEKAVENAYADKLFSNRYATAYLFLTIPADKLDVNIHPNKTEIRFDDEKAVSAAIEAAIKEALLTKGAIPEIKKENIFKMPTPISIPQEGRTLQTATVTYNHEDIARIPEIKIEEKAQEQVDIKTLLSNLRTDSDEKAENFSRESEKSYSVSQNHKVSQFDPTEIRVLGSLFASYIVGQDEECLYLIDQHAAHERVMYEKLLNQWNSDENIAQPILTPMVINVLNEVKGEAPQKIEILNNMGFEIEEFGYNAYIVKALPVFMDMSEGEDFVRVCLNDSMGNSIVNDQKSTEKIILKACKSAVKANDLLSSEEIDALLNQLAKCDNPHTCPHGRPVFIRLTKHEVEKLFKRV